MNYANFPSQEKIHFPQVGVSIALVMDCSCKVLGEECDIRKLGIRYHDPRAFVESAVSKIGGLTYLKEGESSIYCLVASGGYQHEKCSYSVLVSPVLRLCGKAKICM